MYRLTRLKSEVIYSGKDFICFNDKKKKEGKPKISGLLTKKLNKKDDSENKYFERTM